MVDNERGRESGSEKKENFKGVPLHAPITWNKFELKQKKMTNVTGFHGQHFLCSEGI